jgi:deazaflavin-dependent oxidoreductase (nitroreductase family)
MIRKWFFRQFMRMQVYFYRRSSGRMMGTMRGMPLLVLTTVGRKTGKERVTPVMYLRDGVSYIITASNAGGDTHPGWFVNLRSNLQARIEVGGETIAVTARVAGPEERPRLWADLVAKAPFFEAYRTNTTHQIPIVILTPLAAA